MQTSNNDNINYLNNFISSTSGRFFATSIYDATILFNNIEFLPEAKKVANNLSLDHTSAIIGITPSIASKINTEYLADLHTFALFASNKHDGAKEKHMCILANDVDTFETISQVLIDFYFKHYNYKQSRLFPDALAPESATLHIDAITIDGYTTLKDEKFNTYNTLLGACDIISEASTIHEEDEFDDEFDELENDDIDNFEIYTSDDTEEDQEGFIDDIDNPDDDYWLHSDEYEK